MTQGAVSKEAMKRDEKDATMWKEKEVHQEDARLCNLPGVDEWDGEAVLDDEGDMLVVVLGVPVMEGV